MNDPFKQTGRPKAELILLIILASISAFYFITQEINCFSEDGWFENRDYLFSVTFGECETHPSNIPSVAYWINKNVLILLGISHPTREIYTAVVLHHLMLLTAGLSTFMAGRYMGLGNKAFIPTILAYSLTYASHLPHSFWPDNFTMPLLSLSILATLKGFNGGDHGGSAGLGVINGVFIGLLTIIKPTFLMIIPAMWLLGAFGRDRRGFARYCIWNLLTVLVIMSLWMSWNMVWDKDVKYSNSLGRHLWTSTSWRADKLYSGDPDYERMLQSLGLRSLDRVYAWDLRDRMHSSQDPYLIENSQDNCVFESFIRPMVFRGIIRRPDIFLENGLSRVGRNIAKPPDMFGLQKGAYNPLNRTERLHPIASVRRRYDGLSDNIIGWLGQAYKVSVYSILIWLGMTIPACALIRYGRKEFDDLGGGYGRLLSEMLAIMPYMLFLSTIFLGHFFLNSLMVGYARRYPMNTLPTIALMMTLIGSAIINIIRKGSSRDGG
ncbi:hypothetical protein ACFLRF_00820 [Candidatus Altiarchaeota archaeon]